MVGTPRACGHSNALQRNKTSSEDQPAIGYKVCGQRPDSRRHGLNDDANDDDTDDRNDD